MLGRAYACQLRRSISLICLSPFGADSVAQILVAPAILVGGKAQRAAPSGAATPAALRPRRSLLLLPVRLAAALLVGTLRCAANAAIVLVSDDPADLE